MTAIRHPIHLRCIVLFFLTSLLSLSTAPLVGQTSDVFTNTKIYDLKSHETEKVYGQRAAEMYNLGLEHAATVQRLARQEQRTPREDKRLHKAYRRAVRQLEDAVEAAPDWTEPRMALGAVHYQMKEYEKARHVYREVLELDPENADAAAFLETVEYYLQRAREEPGPSDAGGGG